MNWWYGIVSETVCISMYHQQIRTVIFEQFLTDDNKTVIFQHLFDR